MSLMNEAKKKALDAMIPEETSRPTDGPFKFIMEEHRRINRLIVEAEDAPPEDTATREECFNEIRRRLTVHAEMEEKLLYPELKKMDDTDLANHAYDEHAEIKACMKELEAMDSGTAEWGEKMTEFRKHVEHHVLEEETKILPKAKIKMSEEDQERLGEEMETFLKERSA